MENDGKSVMASPRRFAAENGVGIDWVYEQLRNGSLPHMKAGRKYLIPRKTATQWLLSCGGRYTAPVAASGSSAA